MSSPKLHHYVPQFYLERVSENGRLWAFDKNTRRSFPASPKGIAAESHFYKSPLFNDLKQALFIETELSHLEADAAQITAEWIAAL